MKNTNSIPTGLAPLDSALGGGLRPGTLTVIAGRPGMGGTSLALQIGKSIAKTTGKKGWLYTGGSGNLLHHRYSGVQPPFTVCDTPHLSTDMIERKLTGADVSCVVIDRLLNVAANQPERYNCFSTALPAVARELKHLARALHVPVICTGALRREMERRKDRHPTETDYRTSLPVGDAADTALLLYREDYYYWDDDLPEQRPHTDAAEITVLPRGSDGKLVRCRWNEVLLRFEEKK